MKIYHGFDGEEMYWVRASSTGVARLQIRKYLEESGVEVDDPIVVREATQAELDSPVWDEEGVRIALSDFLMDSDEPDVVFCSAW